MSCVNLMLQIWRGPPGVPEGRQDAWGRLSPQHGTTGAYGGALPATDNARQTLPETVPKEGPGRAVGAPENGP